MDTTKGREVRSVPIEDLDDNEDSAEMLAAVLEIRGYETRVADEPHQALEIARTWQPPSSISGAGFTKHLVKAVEIRTLEAALIAP